MDFAGQFYPNPDNFPEPSFPQELLTPVGEPDEDTLLYAYNPVWTEVLLAAVDQLRLYSTWLGDHDEKILAVNRAETLKYLLRTPIDVGDREWPTPFWDDQTDVDDEAESSEQSWYGEVPDADAPADELTFVENAVIWLLTGFVAAAATPAAAVFFRTIAPRFVLSFNRGDVREVWRIVIDAADYDTVDTDGLEAGDIVDKIIDGLGDLETHDILLVRTL